MNRSTVFAGLLLASSGVMAEDVADITMQVMEAGEDPQAVIQRIDLPAPARERMQAMERLQQGEGDGEQVRNRHRAGEMDNEQARRERHEQMREQRLQSQQQMREQMRGPMNGTGPMGPGGGMHGPQ